MNISEQVHYQIIRVALGYSLLGITVATGLICLVSVISIRGKNRLQIEPKWLRNTLYSSLLVELIAAAVLMFRQITVINTKQASQEVTTKLGEQAANLLEENIRKLGIVRYWEQANDFLPEIRSSLKNAKVEVMISGASFYLSVPANEDLLLAKANEGVRIRYLILDPNGRSLATVARSFNQSEAELKQECEVTVTGLRRIISRLRPETRQNFQVRLFDESPRARFYIFDPDDHESVTYFVPHVNAVNSPQLPGFQLKNSPFGLAQLYIPSVMEFWEHALPLPELHPEHAVSGSPTPSPTQ